MTTFLNESTNNQYPTISLNHEYAPHRFIHLITPPLKNNSVKRCPLIVFIADNQKHLHLVPLAKLSQHGFVIAIFTIDNLIVDQQLVREVKTAIRFLLLHATQFIIDTNRIFLWGEKHGAEIGAQVLLTANVPEWNNEDPRVLPLRFRAGILFGITTFQDLTTMIPAHKRSPLYIYNGVNDDFDKAQRNRFINVYRQISPLDDFLMENTASGSAAFYTPYLLTIVENQIRENL